MPAQRAYDINIYNAKRPHSVTVDGAEVPFTYDAAEQCIRTSTALLPFTGDISIVVEP